MKEMVENLKAISLLFCFIVAFGAIALAPQVVPARDGGQISPAEALSRYEKLLQATSEPHPRFYLTTKAAPTALAAGETKRAKTYALTLLQQAATLQDNWNYGNAIHVGNLVLGLIALAAADVPEAKRLLLEAGKSPGSPQLDSFGPDMLLAKELLAKGEQEVVIQYFDLCAKFWRLQEGQLDAWKAVVIKGGIPDFRANLDYQLNPWRFENWANLQS
ncbi:MAG: hypothetical protein M3Q91_12905 [Acidobacteriota bacterium]|nr:hypothetical protein [Acidobacteriota bacterium]